MKELESLRAELKDIEKKIDALANQNPPLEITPGKWWHGESIWGQFITFVDRVDGDEVWSSIIYWFNDDDFRLSNGTMLVKCYDRPATPEEIRSALVPYCEKKYPVGCKTIGLDFKTGEPWRQLVQYVAHDWVYLPEHDALGRDTCSGWLYCKGKFAEIVPDDTDSYRYDCKGLKVVYGSKRRHDDGIVMLNGFAFTKQEIKQFKSLLESCLSVKDLDKIQREWK